MSLPVPSGPWCDFDEVRKFVEGQFVGEPYSIHGSSHWRRVEQNGLWLAKRSGADPFVVRLFAWFHDACRVNDYTDPGHGSRGAALASSMHGSLFQLNPASLELLLYACTWHTDRDFTDDPTIATCWDADRLDLGRVGMLPSEEFMNTDFGKQVARTGSFYPLLTEEERASVASPV